MRLAAPQRQESKNGETSPRFGRKEASSPRLGPANDSRGYWRVFEDAVVSAWKPVPPVECVVEGLNVDALVDVLMSPAELWESDEENDTSVSLVERQPGGRVVYLKSVKTKMMGGLVPVRLRLWVTQWVELCDDGAVVVVMHAWEESERCHLVSRFIVRDGAPLGRGYGSTLIVYREVTSSPQVAVAFSKKAITKSHLHICEMIKSRALYNEANNSSNNKNKADARWWRNQITAVARNKIAAPELIPWTELPLEEIRKQIMDPKGGVLVSERSWNLKMYPNVLVGNEAVDWIVERYAVSRSGAVALMNELLRAGWLRHYHNEHLFSDEHLFYVWESGPSGGGAVAAVVPKQDAPSIAVVAAAAPAATIDDGVVLKLKKELAAKDEEITQLRKQVGDLKRELFASLAVGLKLSLAAQGAPCTVDAQSLYDEEIEEVDIRRWNVWLSRRLLNSAQREEERTIAPIPKPQPVARSAISSNTAARVWWQSSELLPSTEFNGGDDE